MADRRDGIILGLFFYLLLLLSKYKISLTFESTEYFLFASWRLGSGKEKFVNISQLSSFILGKMLDVQNMSEGFVHKLHIDNYAALQWDEHIGEVPLFRENIRGLGFLQDEWDQGKGFLKGTELVIWGQSGWQ